MVIAYKNYIKREITKNYLIKWGIYFKHKKILHNLAFKFRKRVKILYMLINILHGKKWGSKL